MRSAPTMSRVKVPSRQAAASHDVVDHIRAMCDDDGGRGARQAPSGARARRSEGQGRPEQALGGPRTHPARAEATPSCLSAPNRAPNHGPQRRDR